MSILCERLTSLRVCTPPSEDRRGQRISLNFLQDAAGSAWYCRPERTIYADYPTALSVHGTKLGTASSDPMSIVFRRAVPASRRRKNVRRALAMLGIAAGLLDV